MQGHVRVCEGNCRHLQACAGVCGRVRACAGVCGRVRACAGVCGHVLGIGGILHFPQLSHFIDHMKVCFHVVKNREWNWSEFSSLIHHSSLVVT